jgi:2-dehydropantoate 2-reductase
MRIAIDGAGSLGTILGAFIAKAGIQVDLIDIDKAHVEALNKNGAKIVGKADFTQKVTALTPDRMEGTYDVVFLMIKQTYNKETFAALKPHVNAKSTIVTMQNGIPEFAVVKEFGEENVMGCPVGWGATWKGPGVSELTSDLKNATFDLGRVTGKVTPDMDEIKKILETMCPTFILSNLMGVRYAKLLMNATFSGMSAALGVAFYQVMENEKAMLCIKYLANEVIKVAEADGVKMEPIQGYDFPKLLGFKTVAERDANTDTIVKIWTPHRLNKASMLQDLEKGRKCEIGAINGVVCELGDKYGIDTPLNDQVVDIVSRIESGRLKYQMSNIDLFKIPDTI